MTALLDYASLFRLDGRRIVVVGAGSGIGRECALALAAQGASLIVCDQNTEALEALQKDLAGTSLAISVLDVRNEAEIRELAAAAESVDALVFTPAMNVRKRMTSYTGDEFDQVVSLNLGASFNLIRIFGSAMAERGGGSIVGISSIRAVAVEPGQGVYAATKAGLEMLVRTAASEFGPRNVRVNAIRPGVVETSLTAQLRNDREWYEAYAAKSALGRWARPEEMAGAAVYLVSDASTFVTGSIVTVDGGWTAQDGRYSPPLD